MFDSSYVPSDKQAPWCATIDRSWADATSGKPGLARDVAARWFREAGPYFRNVCERAGLDPDTIHNRALNLLDRLNVPEFPEPEIKRKEPKPPRIANPLQSANGRFPKLVEFQGETLTVAEWAERLGMTRSMVRKRMVLGLPLDTPHLRTGRKHGHGNAPSRLVTHDGLTLTVAEWLARVGISRTTFYGRLARGWSVERMLSTAPTPPSERIAFRAYRPARDTYVTPTAPKSVSSDLPPGVGDNFTTPYGDRRGELNASLDRIGVFLP